MAKRRASKPKRAGRKQPARRRRPPPPISRAIEATLADIAHEIRTPLTGILALGELLATSGLAERERGWATAIKSTAEHLAMLTSLIVDAARADARGLVLRRELLRPRRLAEAVAATLVARADTKGLTAQTSIADDLPEAVIGDPIRLRAALENLTDNAVKFTERGSVRLDVTSEAGAGARVKLIFTVSDSGIGLKAADVKRLFRPFAQANETIARRYGGAGLGLAFVKRIAKAMGGDLAVTPAAGGGSCFRLTVACEEVTGHPLHRPGAAAPSPSAAVRPLHVLCAEDNPYGRVLLNTILTELGHRADFVATGEAAIEAVAHGRYDAVLMDVTLPEISGVEATRRIRALDGEKGRTPVIGISGRGNASDEAAGRAAGMDGYLTKPLSPSALMAVLGPVMRTGSPA